jgi:hypothetical protein
MTNGGRDGTYVVRRLTAADAQAIPELANRVNGPNYMHAEVYNPSALVRLNAEKRLITVVALNADGKVVGQYALERPGLGAIAETGEAMVLAEHRGHHLMERMRAMLESEAVAEGLIGLVGHPVTHHVFSQKVYEQFHCHPTGVSFSAVSSAIVNLQSQLQQRLTLLLYFKYLKAPGPAVAHVPEHHWPILREIYARLAREVDLIATDQPVTGGRIQASISETQTGEIEVVQTGSDCAAQVRDLVAELAAKSQPPVFFARIPLSQPGASAVCANLEAQGFFFSGLVPGDTPQQDCLQLQLLNTPLSFDSVQVESPFAREIVSYAIREHERLTR